MERIMELISLPQTTVTAIREKAEQELEQRNKENKLLLAEKKAELAKEDAKLFSVEEKWISNTISHDTYNRWYTDIMQRKQHLKTLIDRLSQNQTELYCTLYKTLDTLTDLKYVYNKCDASSKQELLRLGFDSNLDYEDGIYRTPTILEPLSHNVVKMKSEGVLIYEKKAGYPDITRLCGS
ncbi:MAG: hypothetical protein J0I41_01560 [Filimonas sp.]|nr:hypothetical protein [Filimonas sp.]